MPGRRRSPPRGQATVEFAIVAPLLAVSVWFILAAGTVVVAQLELTQAARNATREAVASPDPAGTARHVARETTDLRPLTVDVAQRGGLLVVTVSAAFEPPLPLPSSLRPEIDLVVRVAGVPEGVLEDVSVARD